MSIEAISQKRERDVFIDVAKGWGILLVIWGHVSLRLFGEIYSFHMPLFFFLSGCFFKWNLRFTDFALKKIRQLLVPYFIFHLYGILFYSLIYIYSNRSYMIDWDMIESFFPIATGSLNAPLWFLYALFWMSLLYYGIRKLCKNNFLILLICVGLYLLNYSLQYNGITLTCFVSRGLNKLLYLHLGWWGYQYYLKYSIIQWPVSKAFFLLIASVCLFSWLYSKQPIHFDFNPSGVNVFVALSGILLTLSFVLFTYPVKWLTHVVSCLGTRSLCLLGIHFPLLEIGRPVAKMFWEVGTMGYDITVFIVILSFSVIGSELFMFAFPRQLGNGLVAKYLKH